MTVGKSIYDAIPIPLTRFANAIGLFLLPLLSLDCINNKITNLNNLPQSLKRLLCYNNNIENYENLKKFEFYH